MACHILTGSEHAYIKLLADKITDDRMIEAFHASHGLCMPHFQQVARNIRNGDHLQTFVSIQTEHWRHLHADLAEFIDKNRAERMSESMGAEADSSARAIGLLRGLKGVFGLDARSK